MADPAFQSETICDQRTGECVEVLIDPMTGQAVSMTDPGTNAPIAPGINHIYDPASRKIAPMGAPITPRAAVDSSGRARPELTSLLPTAPVAEQPAVAGDSSSSGGYGSGGYGGYSGGYSRGGYSSGGYNDYGTTPRYANGSTHPYFGGPPLTPGGVYAQQSQGYDNRVQVTVPSTGASAGPFGVTAPRAAQSNHPGMGSPGGGGGGGGIARDLYWSMANKIKGKLMGGGSAPASYGDYREQTFRPYRGPDDPRTVRKVDKLDARFDSKASTYTHPEFAIPKNVNLETPLGGRLSNLPGFDLALMAGAGKKNWKGGIDPRGQIYTDYYKALNKRLEHGKQGIDFAPFYRKELRRDKSLKQYNRTLQGIYNQAAQGTAINTGSLFGNLTRPKKGTFLREQFKNAPPGMAADQYLASVGALIQAGEFNDIQQTALAELARNATTQYGQRFSGRNPRHIPSLNRWVGRQLGGYLG